MISVIVTVGPHPRYKEFLAECLESIKIQQCSVALEIVVVDDAAHLDHLADNPDYTYIKNVWNLGQAASLNIGIASAQCDWVFIMGGSDDVLHPECIETCWKRAKQLGTNNLYYPIIETSEGDKSSLAQGVWLLHRSLWAKYGGYPKEAITEVDATLCSLYLTKSVGFHMCGTLPLYWHREWEESLTAVKMRSVELMKIRDILRGMVITHYQTPFWVEGYGYSVERNHDGR